MMEPIIAPVVVPPPPSRKGATLGSLGIAMLVGAIITVALLYVWGSQIAAEQEASAQGVGE